MLHKWDPSQRGPSWALVAVVGWPLHILLVGLYANAQGGLAGSRMGTFLPLFVIGAFATAVAGTIGRVHDIGRWVLAGVLVIAIPYGVGFGILLWMFGNWVNGPH